MVETEKLFGVGPAVLYDLPIIKAENERKAVFLREQELALASVEYQRLNFGKLD